MGTHSRMSPSCAERTINCPGWVKQAEKFSQDYSSKAADVGTLAHHLGHTCLTSAPNTYYYLAHPLPKAEGVNPALLDFAMCSLISDYVEYVTNLQNESKGPACLQLVEFETRVKSPLHSEAHGTGDAFIGQMFGALHVVDLKYGVSPVSPKENKQLMAYASYAIHTFGDFNPIFLHIYQPRAYKKTPYRVWETTSRHVKSFERTYTKAMRTADKPGAKLTEGAWCFFCPARIKCPIHVDKNLTKAKEAFQ